ncbi:MAG: phytanoyl-CoA dioxygenase family protein [Planctomycetaceae bacterium]|nr:phytanoyl-CoA dioxygenase family protein [Planctomycetaceae bacterium]
MRFEDLKPAYDRDGFVVVRQLLPADDFKRLTAELDRYIRDVVPTLPDKHAFYDDKSRPETLKQMQHMGLDPFFKEYMKNPVWNSLASALVGEEVEAQEPEWFNKPANTNHVTPPHQDNYYFCLRPANVLTIWMALDNVDDENGCLRYVKGSHLRGIRSHNRSNILGFSQGITDYSDADRELEVKVHLQPGDVTVHHGNTIHRAEANTSKTRNRRAFAMVIKGKSCQLDQEAYQRYTDAMKKQHEQMGLKS